MTDHRNDPHPQTPEAPGPDVASSVWDPWLLALYALELRELHTPTVH
jgi:hypothetical protein